MKRKPHPAPGPETPEQRAARVLPQLGLPVTPESIAIYLEEHSRISEQLARRVRSPGSRTNPRQAIARYHQRVRARVTAATPTQGMLF